MGTGAVRLGIVGAGRAAVLHAMAAAHAPGVELVAVAGRDRERTESFARRAGSALTTIGGLAEITDLVVVATPSSSHRAVVEELGGGDGPVVLLERPAGDGADDTRLLASNHPRVGTAENLWWAPIVVTAADRIARFGSLNHLGVRVRAHEPPGGAAAASGAGRRGALAEPGASAVALALRLMGPRRPVTVSGARFRPGTDAPTSAAFAVDLDTGERVTIDAAWTDRTPSFDAQAAGPTGAVRVELLPEPHVEQNGRDVPSPAPAMGSDPPELERYGYVGQLMAAHRSVVRAGEAPLGIEVAVTVAGVLDAATRSAADGGAAVTIES
ncbi:MAG: Gfo/Idh/MocA family oxidoreductase [Actinomycetota bacterium]|nr:Gfo/Idh/MocA family oxidoreductase [Actinomycetota bacterium]